METANGMESPAQRSAGKTGLTLGTRASGLLFSHIEGRRQKHACPKQPGRLRTQS
jgi:hypothetical protein